MQTGQQFCFKHHSGEDIYLFALCNTRGVTVLISNYGAIVNAIRLEQADEKTNDIVLGFDSMADYLAPAYLQQYPWFGAAVGRYANRIKNAQFVLDGKPYQLSKNNGNDQLHGGFEGFDKKVWQPVSYSDRELVLKYTSPDGEEGFPGNLEVRAKFELNDANDFSYEYTATTDLPTIVNLTHHSYFNLNNGNGNIADHEVKIYGSTMLQQDSNFVATGITSALTGTPFDFREWKKINAEWDPNAGYDQSFVVDDNLHALSKAAEARFNQSQVAIEVWSTQPVVHFYTGKWIPNLVGKQGKQIGPYSGFCLETQVHPNAINIPGFPDTVLRPGETYHQKTVYKLFF